MFLTNVGLENYNKKERATVPALVVWWTVLLYLFMVIIITVLLYLFMVVMDNQTRFDATLFKDLMNVTEKLQFIDYTFRHSCLVPSSGVMRAPDRSVETLGL